MSESAEVTRAFTARHRIPGYTITGKIGRGGFSVVYAAIQDHLERRVALKVLLADFDDPADARRFRTECRVLGRLSEHPDVVDVYDAGVSPEGLAFIAMRLYSRGTLAEEAHSDPLPVERVVEVGQLIGSALQAAHDLGVTHRDVKPENILVGERGQPAITDFGISALADPTGKMTTSLAFSRSHAAPEVLDANKYGPASDQYSLASSLYALLAGHPAFQEATDFAQMRAVLYDPVPPLNRPDIPEELAAAITRGMAKDPADRYPTVADFARALSRAQATDRDLAGPQPISANARVAGHPTWGAAQVKTQTPYESTAGSPPPEPDTTHTQPDGSAPVELDDATRVCTGKGPSGPAPTDRPSSKGSSSAAGLPSAQQAYEESNPRASLLRNEHNHGPAMSDSAPTEATALAVLSTQTPTPANQTSPTAVFAATTARSDDVAAFIHASQIADADGPETIPERHTPPKTRDWWRSPRNMSALVLGGVAILWIAIAQAADTEDNAAQRLTAAPVSAPVTPDIHPSTKFTTEVGSEFAMESPDCYAGAVEVELQVQPPGSFNWTTVETTTSFKDTDACTDPNFGYNAVATWTPKSSGLYITRWKTAARSSDPESVWVNDPS